MAAVVMMVAAEEVVMVAELVVTGAAMVAAEAQGRRSELTWAPCNPRAPVSPVSPMCPRKRINSRGEPGRQRRIKRSIVNRDTGRLMPTTAAARAVFGSL
eukprot:2121579-Prymnesium_polylepis.2